MAKDAKSNKDVKKKKYFFKDFKAELKKVIWPTPKQLANKTMAVIVIVLMTAAIVFILDVVFDLLNEKGINKLKSNIRNKMVVENTVNDSEKTEQNNTENSNTEEIGNENQVENVQ